MKNTHDITQPKDIINVIITHSKGFWQAKRDLMRVGIKFSKKSLLRRFKMILNK